MKAIIHEDFEILDLISYLKNPKYVTPGRYSFFSNIKYLLWSYFSCLLFILIITVLLSVIDKIVILLFNTQSIQKEFIHAIIGIKHSFGVYSFLVFALIGPLVEETIFRLPMNLKKSSIGLSAAVLLFRFSGNSLIHVNLYNLHYFLLLITYIFIIVCASLYIPDSLINKIKYKYFFLYFYFISITFGLIHILNLNSINFKLILIYPLFVLPQVISGLFIANNRMNRGFIWGFFLHALINSTSFLL